MQSGQKRLDNIQLLTWYLTKDYRTHKSLCSRFIDIIQNVNDSISLQIEFTHVILSFSILISQLREASEFRQAFKAQNEKDTSKVFYKLKELQTDGRLSIAGLEAEMALMYIAVCNENNSPNSILSIH